MNISPLPNPKKEVIGDTSIPSGEIYLYADPVQKGKNQQAYGINISYHTKGARQSLVGTWINDKATICAFNLPVGTVVTLMEHEHYGPPDGIVHDLKGCGRCVDLVGRGETVWFDLGDVNMNDCVSMFFWREVDFKAGTIELYEHNDFKGNRNIIFLGEWPSKKYNPITGWWLEDKVSSVRWQGLADTQQVTIAEHFDGEGRRYADIAAWNPTRERASLPDMNDCMSSFRWDAVAPSKEEIDPITISVDPRGPSATTLTATETGVNRSSLPQPVTVSITDTHTQTVTVTLVDTILVSAGLSIASSMKIPATATAGAAEFTFEVTISLRTDYSHSVQQATSVTKSVAVNVSQTANAPPHSKFKCDLFVKIGQIPRQIYKTNAKRWYNQPVSGAVRDGNLWLRNETVAVEIGGGIASHAEVHMDATPL